MSRAFKHTLGSVVGAMRLLAESYADPSELNANGFALYRDFRPDSGGGTAGWGKRAEMRMSSLLSLRRPKVGQELKEEEGGVMVAT